MNAQVPLPGLRPGLVSEQEFLALPETGHKVELLDGEVVVAPSPTVRHQVLVQRLLRILLDWAETESEPVFVGQAPLDVRFGHGRILQPDLFVIRGQVSLDHEGPIELTPELCIEVLSADRVYDRVTKRAVYAAAGIREYWVVEQHGPIETWHGAGLSQFAIAEERLDSLTFPGLAVDVRALFAS